MFYRGLYQEIKRICPSAMPTKRHPSENRKAKDGCYYGLSLCLLPAISIASMIKITHSWISGPHTIVDLRSHCRYSLIASSFPRTYRLHPPSKNGVIVCTPNPQHS